MIAGKEVEIEKALIALLTFLLFAGPLILPPKASAASGVTFASVSSQNNTTVALDGGGQIWAWGSNISGNFGDGTTLSSATPKRIEVMDGGSTVTFQAVRTGWNTSMALDSSGGLWMTGEDGQGVLGNGPASTSNIYSWTKLPVSDGGEDVDFTEIAIGRAIAYAIDSDGYLWGWGRSIGDVPVKQNVTDGGSPVAFKRVSANNEAAIALDTSNRLWKIYSIGVAAGKYAIPDSFRSISTGNGSGSSGVYVLHAALDTGSHVWTWGENESGQLGDGGTTDTVTPAKRMIEESGSPIAFASVSAGERFVLGLDTNGDIWSWGLNNQGQLGDGTTHNAQPHKLTVTDDGDPVRFQSVAAGYGQSYAIDADGRIWTWGRGTLKPMRLTFAPSVTLSVSPATSSTKLQSVTVTATVAGDLETPTGTVQFWDGSTLLASAPLAGGVAT